MDTIQAVGIGFVLPALLSFICLALAARSNLSRRRALLGAFAIGAIPFWCYGLNLIHLWPEENWQWLVWLGLLACIIRAFSENTWILRISYILFALLASWLLFPNSERFAGERWYWTTAIFFALIVYLVSTIGLSDRIPGPSLPVFLLLATFAAAILILCGDLLKATQMAGIVAGVMAGCCLASFCFPARPLTSAIAPGWAVLYPGMLIEARLYSFSDVPLVSYLLLICAPLTIWLTALPSARKMKAVWRISLGLLLLLAPIAVGLYWAGQVAVEDYTEAEVPRWLLQIARRLLGKPPLVDMVE